MSLWVKYGFMGRNFNIWGEITVILKNFTPLYRQFKRHRNLAGFLIHFYLLSFHA